MLRSLLYLVAGSVAAWVSVDLLYNFLRLHDSYGPVLQLWAGHG
jgi:hypothetical protein